LWLIWRRRDVNIKTSFYVGLLLGVIGAVLTFPTFFQAFSSS
jgi:hypothetical protein